MRVARRTALPLVAWLTFAACTAPPPVARDALGDDALTVASFDFDESVLLAEIYAQAFEAAGIDVSREVALGPRELVMPALVSGLVEFVPEYAGSGLEFLGGQGSPSADAQRTHRELVGRLRVRDLTALDASPAEDQNGFAVTAETARRYGLRTLSDLARVADRLTFGGPPECASRPRCLPGLSTRYGIRFEQVLTDLDVGGSRTVSALAEGTIDVALLFTSDGSLKVHHFVLLRDDKGLQLVENITPVLRQDALDRFGPVLAATANAVSARLSTDGLRALNAEVARGDDPAQIAANWLVRNGLTGP